MGIGWIKGPCKQKEAHVETETDKVTESRVALTERESESVLVITVFTFLLSCFVPLRTLSFFLSSSFLIFYLHLLSLQPRVAEMQTNCDANALPSLLFQLSLSLVGHCASFGSQPDCSLQTSLPSSSSYWVCHAE